MAGSQKASGALASTIISEAQYDYNETGTGFIANAEWLRWLNDAAIDIALKTLCMQTVETISLVTKTVDYAITTDFIKVVAVRYVNASLVERGLVEGHPKEVGNIQDRGEPDKFYEFRNYLGVYPAITGTVTTETVKVFLAYLPAVIGTTAALVTPAIYDHLVKKYMLAQASKKDKRFGTYAGLINEYNTELAGSRQDLGGEKDQKE